MAFIFGSPDAGAPTLDASTLPAGQPVGASSLPGAPTSSVSLNSGITFQPPSSGGGSSGFRFGDPNNFAPPADVTFAANPINTAGLFGSVPTAGAFGGSTPATSTTSTTSTTTKTDTSATDDALNRLIDLAAQQSAGSGAGGGGIVALPTGIADTGTAASGGISPVAIVVVVLIIGGALWYFHKKNKAKAS